MGDQAELQALRRRASATRHQPGGSRKPVPVVQKEILEVPVIREITVPIDRPCLRCTLNQTAASSGNGEFPTIEQMERSLIAAALDHCQGDRLKAAAMLGIGKTTIYRKLRGGIRVSLCVLQCDP